MKDLRTGAIYFLGLGLFSLAAALVYFSVQLANVTSTISKELPDVLASVNQTSDKIGPVVKEIGQIREMVPPILKEVTATRKQIPAVLEEVREVRKQIPVILDEVRKTRPLIPKVLDEVATTRKAIPGMLSRGEEMISDARNIGSEASSGAVTGFFKGIITAPFAIIGGVGSKLFGLSDEAMQEIDDAERKRIENLGKEVLALEEIGSSRKWEIANLGYSGKLTLKAINTDNGGVCKDLHVQVWKNRKASTDMVRSLCRNEGGEWEEASSEND